jgi:WD40 repeat protein
MKRQELATALGAAALLMAIIGGFVWVRSGAADRVAPLAQRDGSGSLQPQRELMGRTAIEVGFARMQRNESRFLADLARHYQLRGDIGTALALALETLPGGRDDTDRIYVAEAELRLESAWRSLRERHVLVGHEYAVNGAAFSPDSKLLVTASTDKSARLWHVGTGMPIGMPLTGHTDRVTSVAFSPDGTRIVTASADRTARIWDPVSGRQITTLTGHSDLVNSAAFSPDGSRIVTASRDGTVRLWDAATGKPLGALASRVLGNVRTAIFSPDGKRIATASTDKTARLWDADTRETIGVLTGHTERVSSAAFSSDGKSVVSG